MHAFHMHQATSWVAVSLVLAIALAGFVTPCAALRDLATRHAFLSPYLHRHAQPPAATSRGCPADVSPCVLSTPYGNATEMFFDQHVDHFSWARPPGAGSKYKQRFFVSFDNWRNDSTGCVFFYLGNEADVTLYVQHTGLMWENAKEFGALVVFAEHRYYGSSLPLGNASAGNLQYLTHEQALADYAVLVQKQLRGDWAIGQQRVIAFGGSYGGMLAAWARVKYPATFAGAIAASAPILGFAATPPTPSARYDFSSYWRVVTRDATAAAGSAAACSSNVRAAWKAMFSLAETPQGLSQLSHLFSTCQPLQSVDDVHLLAALYINAWDTLAMGNFPYPSNYLSGSVDLPSWPFRVACDFLADPTLASRPVELLRAFVSAAAVFNNCTQDVQCYELPAADPFFDGLQWDYQWCTQLLPEELFFPMRGDVDMFFPRDFTSKAFLQQHCGAKYNVSPRSDWIPASYGDAYAGTNVVFSNGLFDPWSSAGVLNASHPSVVVVIIPEGAHHIDLFFSNDLDPDSVRAARAAEITAIRSWLQE